ncbi:hypothetical protein D3C83_93620 [compost metagenome]
MPTRYQYERLKRQRSARTNRSEGFGCVSVYRDAALRSVIQYTIAPASDRIANPVAMSSGSRQPEA